MNKATAFHESEGSRTLLHAFTCNNKEVKVKTAEKCLGPLVPNNCTVASFIVKCNRV